MMAGEPIEERRELTQDELDDMEHPLLISYALMFDPPSHIGTMLSPDGDPVYLDYARIDWKVLASELQQALSALGVPKGIKVYVGTDAFDVFDGSQSRPGSDSRDESYNAIYEAHQCFKTMSFANFRAGLITFPKDANFHITTPVPGKPRTPVTGIFVAFRFDRQMQALDYLTGVTGELLGIYDSLMVQPGVYREVSIPDALRNWMLTHIGVVPGEQMEVFRMPRIYRGKPARKQAQ